jgi:hypothetical protein
MEVNENSENSSTRTVEIEEELWNRYTAGGTQDINERMWEIWEEKQEEDDLEDLKKKVKNQEAITQEEAEKCKKIKELSGSQIMLAYLNGAKVDGLSKKEIKAIISQIYGQVATYEITNSLTEYAVEIDGDYYFNSETALEYVNEQQEDIVKKLKKRKSQDRSTWANEDERSAELKEELGKYNQIETKLEDGDGIGVKGWG